VCRDRRRKHLHRLIPNSQRRADHGVFVDATAAVDTSAGRGNDVVIMTLRFALTPNRAPVVVLVGGLMLLSAAALGQRVPGLSAPRTEEPASADVSAGAGVAVDAAGPLDPSALVPSRPTKTTYAPVEAEAPPTLSTKRSEPLPPSAFQRFVKANTGKLLPLFGADYFQLPPSTFAPARSAGVPADYVLGPGDAVFVRVTGVLELSLDLVVDPSGRVVLPKVGPVALAGVKAGELDAFLTREMSRSFRNFTLTASLTGLRSTDVYVVGQARQPGKHTISSMSSLVNALFASGGPNAEGSLRRIQLMRAGKVVAEFDLYRFITTGEKLGDVHVQSGDTLFFPVSGPRVAVLGAVRTPAIFELRDGNESLGDVLALQGGVPSMATLRAHLERVDGQQAVARSVVDVTLDAAGLQQPVKDGDVLFVFDASPEIGDAVTLRGNVARPGRYRWSPGLRVRDLIPAREALIAPTYHEKKNRLVLQADDADHADTDDGASKASHHASRGDDDSDDVEAGGRTGRVTKQKKADVETARQEVREMLDEVNWEYAVVERLDRKALATTLLPFHLGRAVLDGDERDNLLLEPGDVVTVFGTSDMAIPQERRLRLVRVEGEVGAPGVYQLKAGETLPDLLKRVGGLTPQAFVFGTALTRVSAREAQQRTLDRVVRELEAQAGAQIAERRANVRGADAALQQAQLAAEEQAVADRLAALRAVQPEGRIALELDSRDPQLPAVVLEDGDAIRVPSRPSFVVVVGAAYAESSLVWRDGRTVDDYLDIAGLPERADLDAVFVLRADGTVRARGDGFWSWWGNPVRGMALQPGDVIVVPEKVAREAGYTAFLRELKDWTQILANAGVSVAVIASLMR
jgi:protein involved in polysaccharide export with SLBB domain